MSLPAQNVAPQAVAAPGQTIFPFAWRCDDSLLVAVWVNDVQDGGFTVLRNADQTASPGGTITRGVACVGGEVVTVERASPQTQTTTLTRYGPFPADTITNIFDKAIMLSQEGAAILGKCMKSARSALALFSSLELPAPQDRDVLMFIADSLNPGKFKPALVQLDPGTAVVVDNEPVARTGAGVYTLVHVPAPASRLKVYLNGVRQKVGTHYTVAGAVITFLAGFIPDVAEVVIADYTY